MIQCSSFGPQKTKTGTRQNASNAKKHISRAKAAHASLQDENKAKQQTVRSLHTSGRGGRDQTITIRVRGEERRRPTGEWDNFLKLGFQLVHESTRGHFLDLLENGSTLPAREDANAEAAMSATHNAYCTNRAGSTNKKHTHPPSPLAAILVKVRSGRRRARGQSGLLSHSLLSVRDETRLDHPVVRSLCVSPRAWWLTVGRARGEKQKKRCRRGAPRDANQTG